MRETHLKSWQMHLWHTEMLQIIHNATTTEHKYAMINIYFGNYQSHEEKSIFHMK